MSYHDRMKNVPELMVTTQVAELLGVTRKTIWAWAKDGIMIPAAITSSTRPYLLFDAAEVTRMAEVLRLADEAQAERDRAEAEAWEEKRLERLKQLEQSNPAGLSKAERLNAIEENRARKAAERVASNRRPRARRSPITAKDEATNDN